MTRASVLIRIALAILATLGALITTGCHSSGDPREDGFFGGVSGLASGNYRQMVQDRRSELEQEEAARRELEETYAEKERESDRTAGQIGQTRAEIDRLDSELDQR